MTEIYFLRHSEILKANNIENNDSLQLKNEKMILSIKEKNLLMKNLKKRRCKILM